VTLFQYIVVAMLGGGLYGFGWSLAQIMNKLDKLIDIANRIGVQDRD
jgi:hypothetical protein